MTGKPSEKDRKHRTENSTETLLVLLISLHKSSINFIKIDESKIFDKICVSCFLQKGFKHVGLQVMFWNCLAFPLSMFIGKIAAADSSLLFRSLLEFKILGNSNRHIQNSLSDHFPRLLHFYSLLGQVTKHFFLIIFCLPIPVV